MQHFIKLVLIGLICFIYSLKASCATTRDVQSWLNLTAVGTIPDKDKKPSPLKYWLEGQQRMGDDSSRSTQSMIRPGIGYAITPNTSVWVGYAWVHTAQPLTTSPFTEDRIWQQLLWIKTTERLTFSSRTRLEQRFLENTPNTAYRIRQLVKLAIPINPYSKLSFVSSDELFWHKNNFVGRNSRGFDQNRLFVGFSYKINPALTTEFGYMNQYIRRFGVPNFLANIVSINFFLTLGSVNQF